MLFKVKFSELDKCLAHLDIHQKVILKKKKCDYLHHSILGSRQQSSRREVWICGETGVSGRSPGDL